MLVAVFEGKAKAAETERRRALWMALETAHLNRLAYHAPNKMPSLAKLLGEEIAGQTGDQRRALLRGFVAARGGKIRKRGQG